MLFDLSRHLSTHMLDLQRQKELACCTVLTNILSTLVDTDAS